MGENRNNLTGLTLEDAQTNWSREVRLVESAPPIRPVSNRPPRKKNKANPSEIKAPRVQSWGEMRVLRVREIVEKNVVAKALVTEENALEENALVEDDATLEKTAILEITTAREEAFSPSFAAALLS